MMALRRLPRYRHVVSTRFPSRRQFSASAPRLEILDASTLPERIEPNYVETPGSSLLSLRWPRRPPRNILLIPKLEAPDVTVSVIAFAKHLHDEHPDLNLVFESQVATTVHEALRFPIYTTDDLRLLPRKTDLVTTLGGDGTILRAAGLFSTHTSVPPILAFSMGSLGFLGEWKFDEHKRAWREVYMSGCGEEGSKDLASPHTLIAAGARSESDLGADEVEKEQDSASDRVRGQNLGLPRASKILLRHRIKAGLYDGNRNNINAMMMPTSTSKPGHSLQDHQSHPHVYALNELVLKCDPLPHLAYIDIYVNNHFFTEAVADGIMISTPTGSTAYSLSSGGSIVHPLVKCFLITPICPRSLSFRPVVLPLDSKVVLKLSKKNRGSELGLSIDGKRVAGVRIGMEIHVDGETVGGLQDGTWRGGVPCVIRAPGKPAAQDEDDGWVGGLNGLLKFNYPFGDKP